MKRLITMVAVFALVGVWTARAEDEAKPANPTTGVAAEKAPEAAPAKAAFHCLAIKDGVAICCACGGDCKCKLSDDGKTCTCGKPVKECPLAGKFCCEKCLQCSDKACKCPKCGGEMKAVPAKAPEAPKAE